HLGDSIDPLPVLEYRSLWHARRSGGAVPAALMEEDMDAASGEFSFTRLEKVIFGPGKIVELSGELERRGLKRAVIVTGQSLARGKLVCAAIEAGGGGGAAVFDRPAQPGPASTVRALTSEIERTNADTVISFGGGSPIDTAKVATASAINGRDMISEARE